MEKLLYAFSDWFFFFAMGFWLVGIIAGLVIERKNVSYIFNKPTFFGRLNRILLLIVISMFASGAGMVTGFLMSAFFWAVFPNEEADPVSVGMVSLVSIAFFAIFLSFFVTGKYLSHFSNEEVC